MEAIHFKLLPVPEPDPLSLGLLVSSEPSTNKTLALVSAVHPHPQLSYSATVYVKSFEVRSV